MKMKKGLLIAFEGIDGTGKTSLAIMLKKRFEALSFTIEIFKEPTNITEAGKKIRESYVNDRPSLETELQWFLEDRGWDVEHRILPALEEKKIVFMDRYFFSTACYQGVRNNNDWESILNTNRDKFPEPDLTIIFDLDVKVAIQRIVKDRSKINTFEGQQYLQQVRDLFLEIYNNDQVGNYFLIDSEQSIEDIVEILYNLIHGLIKKEVLVDEEELKEENKIDT
ncbi:MAG: dTMP kinase [Candidatus Heimdallarchaeota archaeon]